MIYYTIKNRRDGTEKEETRTKYKPEWISRHQKKAQRTLSMQEGNMCECATGKTFYIPQHHWRPSGPTLYPFTVLLKMSVCSLECCKRLSTFSQDTPDFFKSRANLCTGQCRRERVVTDGHGLLCVVHIHLKKE